MRNSELLLPPGKSTRRQVLRQRHTPKPNDAVDRSRRATQSNILGAEILLEINIGVAAAVPVNGRLTAVDIVPSLPVTRRIFRQSAVRLMGLLLWDNAVALVSTH